MKTIYFKTFFEELSVELEVFTNEKFFDRSRRSDISGEYPHLFTKDQYKLNHIQIIWVNVLDDTYKKYHNSKCISHLYIFNTYVRFFSISMSSFSIRCQVPV